MTDSGENLAHGSKLPRRETSTGDRCCRRELEGAQAVGPHRSELFDFPAASTAIGAVAVS